MTGFYFTLLAVLLAGLGARDQATVAGLARRQGQRPGLLLVGIAVSLATAAFAGWAAATVVPLLAPPARAIMAATALLFAGAEALLLSVRRQPREPTASLGALAVVLLAHQLTDAARFLVFAIAVATNAPVPAAIAGAIGGAALLTAGWLAPEAMASPRLRRARRGIGALLVVIAAFVVLRATGRI